MHGEIENWKNGWYGVSLGLSISEIDRLIVLLTNLRNEPEQHFHISSDYAASEGLGDIELYVAEPSSLNNMHVGSKALKPGDSIPK
jgi:hypothetical protein